MSPSSTPIAVASRSFSKHPILRAELLARYSNARFNDDGLSLKGQRLINFLSGCEKAITALEVLDAEVLAALPELKVIGKYGVGLDMIDLEAMKRHNVQLGWTRGVNRRSVAELVISFSIALLRHVPAARDDVLAGNWRQHKGRQLSGKTVGIIGCGCVGKDVVSLLKPFGCTVLAYDIVNYGDFYRDNNVTACSLEELLQRSDIVTLHTPLDHTTRNLISAERLGLMKKDAVLLNLARGGIIDEQALKVALQTGGIAAAGLDVFDPEPPQDRELLELSNFLVSPHIGGSSEEAILAMGRAAIEGLDNFGPAFDVANS